MKRYLLFDAGCAVCNKLAQAIEEAAGGKLEAVSIRDPQARTWLDQAYPDGWEHQPYLVIVEGERVGASSDLGMALRLGWLLGPGKAWGVWNLARRYGVVLPPGGTEFSPKRPVSQLAKGMAQKSSRRQFMKLLGGSTLGALLATFLPAGSNVNAMSPGDAPPRNNFKLERLDSPEVGELAQQAWADPDLQKLREFLESRKFVSQTQLVDGFRVTGDTLNALGLVAGYGGKADKSGAYLMYSAGTTESATGQSVPLHGSMAVIVNDAAYIVKDGEVVASPPATERLHGGPRLPINVEGSYSLQWHCCDEWRQCWYWNGICALYTALCIAGCAPCCGAALMACAVAIWECDDARRCGPYDC